MKKTYLIPLLLFILVSLVSGCGAKKVSVGPIIDPSIVQEVAPVENKTVTEASNKTLEESSEPAKPMECGSDQSCFLNQFLACKPAEFKVVSGDGEFQMNVIGLAGDRCYYLGGFYKNGALANGSGIECRVPKHLITNDSFGHFFGQDKAAGKETIKIEQDRIEADYCSKI